MNHSYRSIYNVRSGTWVAAPETATGRGKGSFKARRAAGLLAAALALAAPAAAALDANALPAGGQVSAGSGAIAQSGNALTVSQSSQNLALNWQSFNIGSAASVNFVQPNSSAIALNRVLGSGKSEIYGKLGANGQVFLLNPNGILFGKNAEVNVGGLVASTLGLSDADFLNRNFRFSGTAGSIVNEGSLNGHYVALLGGQVSNQGTITARLGTVALAAGSDITLDFAGDGLIGVAVNQGALDALAENRQLIRADGGTVLLTAKAADTLIQAVVNNEGVIEARTVENKGGVIKLLGDMDNGLVKVGGRLDASAPDGGDGGFVETSAAKVGVGETARVTTLAARGRNGLWLIDPADYTIAASGGNITGALLSAALGSSNVSILSSSGGSAGNGDIHVNDAVAWSANNLTLTAARDININAVMTASGTSTLTMNTGTANGADAGVAGGAVRVGFAPGNTSFAGRVDFPGRSGAGFLTINGQGYTVVQTRAQLEAVNGDLAGRYALGGNVVITGDWTPLGSMGTPFTGAFNGLGHWLNGYSFYINSGGTDLQGLFGYSTGSLSNVGIYLDQNSMVFGRNYVGALAGLNDAGGIIRNVVFMTDASVVGSGEYVGGLVGLNAGTIVNSHVVGSGSAVYINGVGSVGGLVGNNGGAVYDSSASGFFLGTFNAPTSGFGGLVGFNDGAIAGSYAAGVVRPAGGASMVGGLVGGMFMGGASIVNSYATGTVGWSDASQVGGLVGYMAAGTSVANSYATAAVTGSSAVGGLVGQRFFTLPSVSNSFWNTETSGQATSDGGTGKTSAQLKQAATFAGWDIAATGGSSAVWRIYEGQTSPLLRNFLTPLTVTANSGSRSYDGNVAANLGVSYSVAPNADLLGSASVAVAGASHNVGGYTLMPSGLWSNQQGYDVSYANGALTINRADLTISTSNVIKTYDGTTSAAGSAIVTGGALFGADSLSGGSFAFDNKNYGIGNKSVTVSGVTVNDGNGGGNYTVSYADNTASTIMAASLGVTGGSADNKTYDGTTSATAGGALSGVIGGDSVNLTGAFDTRHAGTGKTVTFGLAGADAGNYALSATTTADITPANLTVSTGNVSKSYDGTTSAAGAVVASGGTLYGSDSLSGGSFAFSDKNAGSNKTVTVSGVTVSDGNSGGNYTVTYADNIASTITPAALSVTAGNAGKTYDGLAYGGGNGVAYSGFVNGETGAVLSGALSYGGTSQGASNAGSYTLVPSGLTSGNYTISYVNGTLTVTPKALTATLAAANKTYDGTTAATPVFTITGGLVGAETVTATSTASFDTKDAGNGKTVTATGSTLANGLNGGLASNYSLATGQTTTADITPAALSVTAGNAGKIYDGTAYSGGNGVSYAGFVNGETVAVLGDALTFGGSSQGAVNADLYAITPGGLTSTNYVLSFIDGILIIRPAPGDNGNSGNSGGYSTALAAVQSRATTEARKEAPPLVEDDGAGTRGAVRDVVITVVKPGIRLPDGVME